MYAINYSDLGTPPSESKATVTLEIDGQPITVPQGTSVMRAAALLGNQVPKLCATDTLKAFGSCRLCLVEIEGRRGYPASCTTLVAEGMKICTESEKLSQLRRGEGTGIVYAATVKAVEPVHALRVGVKELENFLLHQPRVTLAMMKGLVERLREVQDRIDSWAGAW